MKKTFILLLIVFLILVPKVFCGHKILVQPDSDIDKYLDAIAFYGHQLNAVVNDMYLYVGWDVDDKEEMKKESNRALKRLDVLIEKVKKLNPSPEVDTLGAIFISSVNKYKGIFKDIENKDLSLASEELNKVYIQSVAECKEMASNLDFSLLHNKKWPDKPPVPIFTNTDMEKDYNEALILISQKEYAKAFDILSNLKDRANKDSFAYDYILFNLCDVIGKGGHSEDKLEAGSDEIIKYSEEILKKEYSHLFYEFFVRWRTAMQGMYHGLSNWSEIPNWDYNLKRKELIQKIQSYHENNPKDIWAVLQKNELRDIDNINRGGPFGNDTLNYLGVLYMDLEENE